MVRIFNSSKQWTKKFNLTSMVPQDELFSFDFGRILKKPKRNFELNWLLSTINKWKLDGLFATYKNSLPLVCSSVEGDSKIWSLLFKKIVSFSNCYVHCKTLPKNTTHAEPYLRFFSFSTEDACRPPISSKVWRLVSILWT